MKTPCRLAHKAAALYSSTCGGGAMVIRRASVAWRACGHAKYSTQRVSVTDIAEVLDGWEAVPAAAG